MIYTWFGTILIFSLPILSYLITHASSISCHCNNNTNHYQQITIKDIMIKPDGVQRGLIGEIIKRFEQKGYKLLAMKLTAPGKGHMVRVFC